MKKVDFGQVSNSYARAREDIPTSLMDSLLIRNINFEGKKVADIGAGTGALTRKIAMRKGDVIGIEPSHELLEQAKALNVTKNYTIPYRLGTAETTGLEDSQYDLVTVMRAWHWFDREQAITEIKRILKPKGMLLVIDSGFLTGPTVVQKTFGVLSKFAAGGLKPAGSKADAKQRINGFPVEWFEEWQSCGLELRDFYKLDYTVSFTKQSWVDRIESVSWLAGLEELVRKQALKDLYDSLPDEEPFVIPHDCNVCILRLP
ncbi:class I SAM-dependent methyltransferase [Neobacillus niacini]|uniref:class I SAM-dependent methyltransferase n=1 Tax=Neobacillus niacini TaxID=86668 RepID=UPI0021CAE7B3|nr:class I SAM-dependent methyltransferase [Neobacillus niacini]MCM3766824.1 class I SAM-dependent methyltransferase [Neobacillus niacini]